MIHNEIIIINICGLASKTKYFLDLKFSSEELYINENDPEILRRFETLLEMEDYRVDINTNDGQEDNEIYD